MVSHHERAGAPITRASQEVTGKRPLVAIPPSVSPRCHMAHPVLIDSPAPAVFHWPPRRLSSVLLDGRQNNTTGWRSSRSRCETNSVFRVSRGGGGAARALPSPRRISRQAPSFIRSTRSSFTSARHLEETCESVHSPPHGTGVDHLRGVACVQPRRCAHSCSSSLRQHRRQRERSPGFVRSRGHDHRYEHRYRRQSRDGDGSERRLYAAQPAARRLRRQCLAYRLP